MAALASHNDSDSDYGYDLTADEEALLSAVIEKLSPAPATRTTTATTTTTTTDTTPAVEVDYEDFDFDVSELESLPAYGHGPSGGASDQTRPRSMPSVHRDPDVSYPDCESCPKDLAFIARHPLTDCQASSDECVA